MSACIVCKTGEYSPLFGNKVCEKHDVCVSCGIKRKDLDESPLFSREGAFLCWPCKEKDLQKRIQDRITKGFEHKFTNEITCPYCGYEESDSWESADSDDERLCDECGEVFEMQRNIEVTYCTSKKTKD